MDVRVPRRELTLSVGAAIFTALRTTACPFLRGGIDVSHYSERCAGIFRRTVIALRALEEHRYK